MKKITKFFIAIAAVVFLASVQMNVKAQAFENGSMVANAGLGFGWYGYGYGLGSTSSLPFISVSLEKGFFDVPSINSVISVGGIAGIKHGSYGFESYSFNDIVIAARGAIHADVFKVENLDTYAGVIAGLRMHNENLPESPYYDGDFTHLLGGAFIGARYYFNEKFAAFGELGAGTGYLNLGVSLKLK